MEAGQTAQEVGGPQGGPRASGSSSLPPSAPSLRPQAPRLAHRFLPAQPVEAAKSGTVPKALASDTTASPDVPEATLRLSDPPGHRSMMLPGFFWGWGTGGHGQGPGHRLWGASTPCPPAQTVPEPRGCQPGEPLSLSPGLFLFLGVLRLGGGPAGGPMGASLSPEQLSLERSPHCSLITWGLSFPGVNAHVGR